jgi:hypothetical protein
LSFDVAKAGQSQAQIDLKHMTAVLIMLVYSLAIGFINPEGLPSINFVEKPVNVTQSFKQVRITGKLTIRTGLGGLIVWLLTFWTIHGAESLKNKNVMKSMA